VYSAAGLFDVGIWRGRRVDEFPRLAVSVAIGLLFVSLASLVFFADHLAHSLQVDHIMRRVEQNTLDVIRTLPSAGTAPDVPEAATVVPARSSGYVQYVDVRRLSAKAAAQGVNVRLCPRVGEHVASGRTLGWVWPASSSASAADVAAVAGSLHRLVRIGFERTLEQDPSLGMRQLVDAACKALSPAINDPYTAIQAVHHLSVVYTELARRHVGMIVIEDAAGPTSLAIPARSLPEHLDVGMGLIRRYGASEPTVVHALLRTLTTVLDCVQDEESRRAVAHQADLLVRAAERQIREPEDLHDVHAEYGALQRVLHPRIASETPVGALDREA